MTQPSVPQRIGPSAAQDPDLPVEPLALAPEAVLESPSATTAAAQPMPEPGDDRYYALHWGINE